MISTDLVHRRSPEPRQDTRKYSKSSSSSTSSSSKRKAPIESLLDYDDSPPKKLPCHQCEQIFTWLKSDSDFKNPFEPSDPKSISEEIPVDSKRKNAQSNVTGTTNSTSENVTNDAGYRRNNLFKKGIILLPYQHLRYRNGDGAGKIPALHQPLIDRIMDYENFQVSDPSNTYTNRSKAESEKNCHTMFQNLYESEYCLTEDTIKEYQQAYIPGLRLLSLNLQGLHSTICQPFAVSTTIKFLMAGGAPISKPRPDTVFGYHERILPVFLQDTLDLNQFSCNKSGVIFPYLIIEFQPMSGSIWHAENQALGGSAISMQLSEDALGHDEVVFSVTMNDQQASIYVMWSSPTPTLINDKRHIVDRERYYHMQRIGFFLLSDPEHFEQFGRSLINIHKWAASTRLEGITAKLKKYAAQQAMSAPSPAVTIVECSCTAAVADANSNKRSRTSVDNTQLKRVKRNGSTEASSQ